MLKPISRLIAVRYGGFNEFFPCFESYYQVTKLRIFKNVTYYSNFNCFFLVFYLHDNRGKKKKPSAAITLGAYFCQEWSHFMEGMLYFGYPKKSSIVNFDFLKLQKKYNSSG